MNSVSCRRVAILRWVCAIALQEKMTAVFTAATRVCLLKRRNCIENRPFQCFSSVAVHGGFVLFTVRQISCAADTAVYTGHAFDEVGIQHISALLEQCHPAFFDAVAGTGFQLEVVQLLLLQSLSHSVGQAATAGKDAAEVAGIVQHILRQCGDIDVRLSSSA